MWKASGLHDQCRRGHAEIEMSETKTPKKPSRIQLRNRKLILDAALEVFSRHGFRGATLDQIAKQAGLSKPNVLYYFEGKEEIHVTLLNQLMREWLAPLEDMNPDGDPMEELMSYIRRKMDMSRTYPRESRLFANEIIQGAPRMGPHLESGLKPLFDRQAAVIGAWSAAGKLAPIDPSQLLISIWATTQHYADFEAQLNVLIPDHTAGWAAAQTHVETMFRKLLTP